MSRNLKALRALNASKDLRDILSAFPQQLTKTIADSPSRTVAKAPIFSFLASVRETRSGFLNRLCSSKSDKNTPDVKKQQISEEDERKIEGLEENHSTTAPKKLHSVHTSQLKKEKSEEDTPVQDNANLASDSSTLVDDDIKKHIKRLSGVKCNVLVSGTDVQAVVEMLEDFSAGGRRREVFNFQQRMFQKGSVAASLIDYLSEPLKTVESAYNWFAGRMLKNIVDSDFDIDDFLEGAKDAFFIEGDYKTLKPMVSTRLYESMKATTEQFQKDGLQFTMTPESFAGVYIAGTRIFRAKALKAYGSEFDVPEFTDKKQNFWLAVSVKFTRYEHYKLFRTSGEVVEDVTSRRRDIWTFVRGPINVFPIKDDIPGWKVLNIA